ncbi:MAG: ATP-binding protein [Planctomycetota bacterium]|nr:ATP-binding protein [Planctomycetota bacterium]
MQASSATNSTHTSPIGEAAATGLEQELEMLREQLQHSQRMATLGELTSTTTHEFNNLLMTILNYANLGVRNKDEATRDKAFNRILDAANRGAKVTSSVLSMARNRAAVKEAISLQSIIEDTVVLLEREYRKYRIDLRLELDEVPPVLGASNELQRVIVNLLVNARQASDEGSQVRVVLQAENPTQVRLTIRDNGSGISPEVLPRIFDPFFSTKAGPDDTGKGGSGVGLSACKQVIDDHDGRIRVESTLGKGTAFIIRLPVAVEENSQITAQAG